MYYISPVRFFYTQVCAACMRVSEFYIYICVYGCVCVFTIIAFPFPCSIAAMVWLDVCIPIWQVCASVLACYPCVVPVNNSFSRSTMFFLLFSLNFNWLSNEFAL